MIDKLKDLIDKNKSTTSTYKPEFFRLPQGDHAQRLADLIGGTPGIMIHDEIMSQLEELVKSLNPSTRFTGEMLREEVLRHLEGMPPAEYGVWVYYPWSKRLVHLLDEEEFIEVRTSRNQHKITRQERDILSRQKIGVVGLSVGKTISLTMAMERSFGEIRLADYDTLELSNLNRLQTGIHSLGVSKAIIAAREIMEIDPFLKVTCFLDGMTNENMDDFFLKGGKLDVLVDECDGLDIKILCRLKARELRIPVVMDMNDRGTLDIERFDLEPDRPLLHGFIDHLDISLIGKLNTSEEKIPYILPMIGAETLSPRMKASMLEIGESITTWPQLSSSVVLGGAIAADACRRIILDQFHESGRYFVDLEEIVGDTFKHIPSPVTHTDPPLTKELMLSAVHKASGNNTPEKLDLPEETVSKLVQSAILAPSKENNQPWKWLYQDKSLYLFHNPGKAWHYPDPLADLLSLGAASENLVLQAHSIGLEVDTEIFQESEKPLIARFSFSKEAVGTETHTFDNLADMIPLRHTNRKNSPGKPIPEDQLQLLNETAQSIPGARLKIISGKEDLARFTELAAEAEKLRMLNEEGHLDFMQYIRWTPEEASITRDGITIDSLSLSPAEYSDLLMAKQWSSVKYLADWNKGKAFERIPRRVLKSASAIGLITAPELGSRTLFETGRAIQRTWLTASSRNISIHPLNTLVFLFNLARKEKTFTQEIKIQIQALQKEFKSLFTISEGNKEIFLFKLYIAEKPEVRSLRQPVYEVLTLNDRP